MEKYNLLRGCSKNIAWIKGLENYLSFVNHSYIIEINEIQHSMVTVTVTDGTSFLRNDLHWKWDGRQPVEPNMHEYAIEFSNKGTQQKSRIYLDGTYHKVEKIIA